MYSPATPVQILSGPVASFLFYEQAENSYHREGFLLGDVIQNETRTITDNDQVQINITTKIKISSVIPCPQYYYCYEGTGKVDVNKLKQFLGNRFDKVVAWYKHQRWFSPRFTFRDKIIHEQMKKLFSTPPEFFSCYLISTEVSENQSSHFLTLFVRYQSNEHDRVNMQITNMSMPNNVYKHPEPVSETFSKICNHLKVNNLTTKGIAGINNIEKALKNCMDEVVDGFSDDADEVFQLESEVKSLLALRKLLNKTDTEGISNKNHYDSEKKDDNEINSTDTLFKESSSKVQKQPQTKKNTKARARGRGKKALVKE